MEREVHSILGPFGVKEALSRLITEQLSSLEQDTSTEGVYEPLTSGRAATDSEARTDVGLTAFLLKVGEGMGEWRYEGDD